ncbi:MAG: hypothetical protein CMK44_00165 [Porticoccus sp.]|jgi:hypothetical protein|nr:hypothetical protein [Porticoccus sp.]
MTKLLKLFRAIFYTFISFFYFPKNITNTFIRKDRNILLLTPFRREPDLDKVIKELELGIIFFNHDYQKKISSIFFGNHKLNYFEYINYIKDKKIIIIYKIFLNNLVKFLKKKYNLNFVVNFAIHYKSEFLFDYAFTKQKISFFTLHRECLYASEFIRERSYNKLKSIIKYSGTKIIVHNNIVKDIFINSGFCKKNQTTKIGPLKIDNLLKVENTNNKTVIFYIFGTGTLLPDDRNWSKVGQKGWFKLLSNTYDTILNTAEKYPNIKFIFKPKFESTEYNSYHINKVKRFDLKNIEYHTREKNYELLKKSNLIISFGSTVIVEAAIMRKNILIPFFDEANDINYSNFIGFEEIKKSKSACESKEVLLKKLSLAIEGDHNFTLNEKERNKLINDYVGDADGLNSERLKKIFS